MKLRGIFTGLLALILSLPAAGQIINPGVFNITATGSNGVTVSPSPCLPGSICDISLTPLATMKFLANTTGGSAVPIATSLPLDVTLGGTGATTAAGARTNLGLGTMAVQNAIAVAITGGTIDNVAIGGSTRASGLFTTVGANLGVFVTGGIAATQTSSLSLSQDSASTSVIRFSGADASTKGIGSIRGTTSNNSASWTMLTFAADGSMTLTPAGLPGVSLPVVASADRNLILSASSGGNPTISTSAGSLAITPAVVGASSFTATSFIPSSSTIPTNGLYLPNANVVGLSANSQNVIQLFSSGTVANTAFMQSRATGTAFQHYYGGGDGVVFGVGAHGVAEFIDFSQDVASSPAKILRLVPVASAARYAMITPSVSGQVLFDVSAGSMNFGGTTATGVQLGGSTALTLTAGAVGLPKITASASAPGASGGKLELVCGTNAGSAKLVIAAGTSATAVTVVDNIGSGVSGC